MSLAKKSFKLLRLPPLKSLVALTLPFTQAACFLKLFAPKMNDFGTWRNNTNARCTEIRFSFAELQSTQRFLLRAHHHVRNKKEGKTTKLENESLRNYDIAVVCLSMTS